MSESEAVTLSTDCNYKAGDPPNHGNPIGAASILESSNTPSVDSVQSNEKLKEKRKWKKNKVRKEDSPCKEVQNVVNHLAVKIEVKSEAGNCDKRKPETSPALQNGSEELDNHQEFECRLCGIKFSTDADLSFHVKNDHLATVKPPQKTVKTTKNFRQRMQYYCIGCNGKGFGSRSSFLRHLIRHVSLPQIRLSRLKEVVEERPESPASIPSPVSIPSGRPQVALKRVTVSCHTRSPLRFRLKLTGDPSGKDTFKLVKAISEKAVESEEKSVDEVLCNQLVTEPGSSDKLAEVEASSEQNIIDTETSEVDKEGGNISLVFEEKKEENGGSTNSEGVPVMVEASQEQCTVPSVEETVADSLKDSVSCEDLPTIEVVGNTEGKIMRQMKNGEGEMEKIQGSNPSVIHSTRESGPVIVEKNSFNSNNVDGCEPMQPEFIPIERLDKDTAAQIIESSTRDNLLDESLSLSSQEKVSDTSDTHILCEACGESILGDHTALEDHCLCRGHYKCPICSVACASTDALAVHTKESHQETVSQPVERKKKSSNLRSIRRKHQEKMEKDTSRDSVSDSSNLSSLPSNAEATHPNTPPLTSAPSTTTSESSQPSLNIRISEVTHQPPRVSDRRQSPSAQNSSTSPPSLPQPVADYSQSRTSQHPNAHLRPSRVSESMPPPLMRPPNARNLESQAARGNLPNIRMSEPLQPPPALYKMPTTSHGTNNSQMGLAVSTVSNPGYARGIPASGYQSDPQTSSASNLAAMSARYQSMHHGYHSGSQPPSPYAPYPQSVQMHQAQMMQQQRFQMGPPPPYPNQMHHLQQASRVAGMSQEAYNIASSQQAYNQSLLKAHLEQTRMQLPQPSTMLQSIQNLQQEHYQQQQLQQQLFQQPPHQQMMQSQQQEQSQGSVPPPQPGQKRKGSLGGSAGLRYHHQAALNNQQNLQNQLQQTAPTPMKQRRVRDNIGIPSKQTDSDCEIIAVQQRGEGVPVIQSIQGSNGPSSNTVANPAGDASNGGASSAGGNSQTSPESTIHLTDSITLSVRQPPGSSSVATAGHRGHNANSVASILATRGITVTPASGSVQHPRGNSIQPKSRPSPPLNHGPTISPPQQTTGQQPNSAISISHSARQNTSQAQHSNDGFAMPAPVGPAQRSPQRQPSPADRPPRPPTVDLTDENAAQAHAAQLHAAQAHTAASVYQCRLCDKQFPSMEALQNHMQLIHQTRNYFRCTICNTKHPSQQTLANHVKRVHKFSGNSAVSELVIPLVDLRNTASANRLSSLGIKHVIALSQLGMNTDGGSFCIPIMSLDPNGQRNNAIGGLMSLGTTAVLPIGPVKSLPNVQQSSQPSPQTVPSSHTSAPPPLAPIRPHAPNQYVQPPHQLPPRGSS